MILFPGKFLNFGHPKFNFSRFDLCFLSSSVRFRSFPLLKRRQTALSKSESEKVTSNLIGLFPTDF